MVTILHDHPELQVLCERDFLAYYPEMKRVFERILHSDDEMFENCIKQFLRLTYLFIFSTTGLKLCVYCSIGQQILLRYDYGTVNA